MIHMMKLNFHQSEIVILRWGTDLRMILKQKQTSLLWTEIFIVCRIYIIFVCLFFVGSCLDTVFGFSVIAMALVFHAYMCVNVWLQWHLFFRWTYFSEIGLRALIQPHKNWLVRWGLPKFDKFYLTTCLVDVGQNHHPSGCN